MRRLADPDGSQHVSDMGARQQRRRIPGGRCPRDPATRWRPRRGSRTGPESSPSTRSPLTTRVSTPSSGRPMARRSPWRRPVAHLAGRRLEVVRHACSIRRRPRSAGPGQQVISIVSSGSAAVISTQPRGAVPSSLMIVDVPVWSPLGDRIAALRRQRFRSHVRPDLCEPQVHRRLRLCHPLVAGRRTPPLHARRRSRVRPVAPPPPTSTSSSPRSSCRASDPMLPELSVGGQPLVAARLPNWIEPDSLLDARPTKALPTPSPIVATPTAQPRVVGLDPSFAARRSPGRTPAERVHAARGPT